ncbi:MAG: OprO/OprP family phosphate-selective porin [Thiovulaceae bacterium]|nr:OprO/OprP family phosphate-selective porin [Sulfurimonadaceae bacterium]
MKIALKTKFLGLALLASCTQVDAADWLRLQGAQPEVVAPHGVKVPYRSKEPHVWGFIQANYKKDFGDVFIPPGGPNEGVNLTPFSRLNPDLKDQSGFNVFRARLAVRGMADGENLINYFFMTEFANNAINNLIGHRNVATYFSDASVTLKHIPGAKLRVGMFKTPGSEEGLQAVFISPYIDFTTMSNQLLLERKVTNVGGVQTGGAAGGAATVHYTSTSMEEPIGAYRDTGAQLFDTLNITKGWDITYAYMYGNGNGISMKASDKQATHYGYLALEDNFGPGRGYFTESVKFYIWGQSGKRTLLSDPSTDANPDQALVEVDANRKRYGVGMTYYQNGLRFEAEYVRAKGMIFTGAKDKDTDPLAEDWQVQFAVGDENVADGGYVNLQYELVAKKFEVFGRYDYLNRLTNDTKAERDFKTATLGCSYRFRGATRVDLNYQIRDIKAPGNDNAQAVVDNIGNRVAVQVTAAF